MMVTWWSWTTSQWLRRISDQFKTCECESVSTPPLVSLDLKLNNWNVLRDSTPKQLLVWVFMRSDNITRPGTSFALPHSAGFMQKPASRLCISRNHILRYLKDVQIFRTPSRYVGDKVFRAFSTAEWGHANQHNLHQLICVHALRCWNPLPFNATMNCGTKLWGIKVSRPRFVF